MWGRQMALVGQPFLVFVRVRVSVPDEFAIGQTEILIWDFLVYWKNSFVCLRTRNKKNIIINNYLNEINYGKAEGMTFNQYSKH